MIALDAIAIWAMWFQFGLDMECGGQVQSTRCHVLVWGKLSARSLEPCLIHIRCIRLGMDLMIGAWTRIKTVRWLVKNCFAPYRRRISSTFFLWRSCFFLPAKKLCFIFWQINHLLQTMLICFWSKVYQPFQMIISISTSEHEKEALTVSWSHSALNRHNHHCAFLIPHSALDLRNHQFHQYRAMVCVFCSATL